MPALQAINVTTTSGITPSIPANVDRDSIILRVTGTDVWFGFTSAAIANQGFFVKDGESLRVSGNKAKTAIYMVTATSTAVVNAETTHTYC